MLNHYYYRASNAGHLLHSSAGGGKHREVSASGSSDVATHASSERSRLPTEAQTSTVIEMGDPLSVETLPRTVRVATLPVASLPAVLHELLALTLFAADERASDERGGFFFSISIAEQRNVTIVSVPEAFTGIAGCAGFEMDPTEWSVVRVGEGALGFETIGVVERLTQPLAQIGVPVLYFSTFLTDYVLLPLGRLEEALGHLTMNLSSGDQAASSANSDSAVAAWHTHPLTVLDDGPSTLILRLDKRERQRHTGALLRLLLMPHARDGLQSIASLTETSDEISILASGSGWWREYVSDHLASGGSGEGIQGDPHGAWVPIRVGSLDDGTPLDETGVVATQAKVLAGVGIPILYLSTCTCR